MIGFFIPPQAAAVVATRVRAKRSWVWDHFDPDGPKGARCRHCGDFCPRHGGSTRDLARHVRREHPNIAGDNMVDNMTRWLMAGQATSAESERTFSIGVRCVTV